MGKEASTGFDQDIYNRALSSIAHGALTNSKRPECLVKGVYPTHLTKGQGAYVWDTKGKRYIDYICGLGSSILGYAHEEVTRAVIDQAKKGATLSLGTDIEVQCAEKVKEIFPWVDRVRFLKTGSDACASALKIARAATGRLEVQSTGYHGHADEFVSMTPPALGVPPHANIRMSDEPRPNTAAVIIEPIVTDWSEDRIAYLRQLRQRCDDTGALYVADEIITGFRWPKQSVSNHHGIKPDLICLGKAMANGMPISVVAGKKEIMECGEYFVSSTFAGETLSLAAALKTMTLLQTRYDMNFLWSRGARFIERFNSLSGGKVMISGYPTRGVFVGEMIDKALFWQEACRAGLLFGPSFFYNFAHPDLDDLVLNTVSDIFTRLRTGGVKLMGEMPKSPFAQKMREIKS